MQCNTYARVAFEWDLKHFNGFFWCGGFIYAIIFKARSGFTLSGCCTILRTMALFQFGKMTIYIEMKSFICVTGGFSSFVLSNKVYVGVLSDPFMQEYPKCSHKVGMFCHKSVHQIHLAILLMC